MDILLSLPTEAFDVNPVYPPFSLKILKCLLQVSIPISWKVEIDLTFKGGSEGSQALWAASCSNSSSVSLVLSTDDGRNPSASPHRFWSPLWPTTMTSPLILR